MAMAIVIVMLMASSSLPYVVVGKLTSYEESIQSFEEDCVMRDRPYLSGGIRNTEMTHQRAKEGINQRPNTTEILTFSVDFLSLHSLVSYRVEIAMCQSSHYINNPIFCSHRSLGY
ncbi:BnaC05g02710D [Brassica napus]|uniref:Uncharacterized protein n=2 Tax=Brassica TaxID=3705 RepID=A0A3P6EZX5_BRAOL|nr:unnamed protein product [Brassica napus]CDY18248.1 BnaC05g02710D [Brassica napus]VDD41511.1 unnamed protein product [Brassica oleracea]